MNNNEYRNRRLSVRVTVAVFVIPCVCLLKASPNRSPWARQ